MVLEIMLRHIFFFLCDELLILTPETSKAERMKESQRERERERERERDGFHF